MPFLLELKRIAVLCVTANLQTLFDYDMFVYCLGTSSVSTDMGEKRAIVLSIVYVQPVMCILNVLSVLFIQNLLHMPLCTKYDSVQINRKRECMYPKFWTTSHKFFSSSIKKKNKNVNRMPICFATDLCFITISVARHFCFVLIVHIFFPIVIQTERKYIAYAQTTSIRQD